MRRAQRRQWMKIILAVGGFVALLGILPIPFGLGPFAWRQFAYDRVAFHLANTAGEALTLEINGSRPVTCPDGEVHSADFRAGDTHVLIRRPDGSTYDEVDFFSDNQAVFYNAGRRCFVVIDLSGLYDPEREGIEQLEIVARLRPDEERLYLIPDGAFVRPRGLPPDKMATGSTVTWIDSAACELLDPENAEILLTQELIRLETRRQRVEELRRER